MRTYDEGTIRALGGKRRAPREKSRRWEVVNRLVFGRDDREVSDQVWVMSIRFELVSGGGDLR